MTYLFPSPSSSAAWVDAQVAVSVAPDPAGGSDLRADGQDDWVDPAALRDDANGRRVHVPASGPCPADVLGVVGVTNSPAVTSALLPPGSPTGGLVCRYGGWTGGPVESPRFALEGSTALSGPVAAAFAARLAAVPTGHADTGSAPWPPGQETVAVVALAYPDRTADLWFSHGNSGFVANGSVLVEGRPLPAVPGGD